MRACGAGLRPTQPGIDEKRQVHLLKQVFDVDIEYRPQYGTTLKIMTAIQ
ncbi:hypothetical protein [Nitrosomonas communis]|nr:hypothetical protein [Nitrosomonas communis]